MTALLSGGAANVVILAAAGPATLIAGIGRTVRRELAERMDRMETRITGRMDGLESRLSRVEHGQAKLKGLLEGLREAITGRRAA